MDRRDTVETQGLLEKLEEYSHGDVYPLHMPGHKRRLSPRQLESVYKMDITEIDGFDNLHDAKEILKDAQDFAAGLYGSEETAFVINGSSAGILSAISALCRRGGRILVSRACHKSVFHAIEILDLEPLYIYPHINSRYGIIEGLSGEDVRKHLDRDVQAVVVTSPTYDGIMSDISGICAAAHERGVPVIVDEAHGAHLKFSDYFPVSAVDDGADIVIQSTHKTLPAMTQTSILHMNGSLVDRDRVRRMLKVYQSSSPSYILMGSIDGCMRMLAKYGDTLYRQYTNSLAHLRESLSNMEHLHLLDESDLEYKGSTGLDRSKLVISSSDTNITGSQLYNIILHNYHIQLEMKSADYVIGMTSVGDDKEGFKRTALAFLETDSHIEMKSGRVFRQKKIPEPSFAISLYEASWLEKEYISEEEASGRVSADYIFLYPPGIPLITPGEVFDASIISIIRYWKQCGMEVKGENAGMISVVK